MIENPCVKCRWSYWPTIAEEEPWCRRESAKEDEVFGRVTVTSPGMKCRYVRSNLCKGDWFEPEFFERMKSSLKGLFSCVFSRREKR